MSIRRIEGVGVPIHGPDIDTDQIIPARFLKAITFEVLGAHLFEDVLKLDDGSINPDYPLLDPAYKDAKIMVVGENFGCGSSREHAPQAIYRYGIRAIIGISFGEIFAGNCQSIGLPAVTVSPEQQAKLSQGLVDNPGAELSVDIEALTATMGDWSCPVSLSESTRERFINGSWDECTTLLKSMPAIKACAEQLPYLHHFKS